ncbi:MAG TPA: UTP--glucose-1-phosphate uridylyltransferase GalU [Chloroflexota bacterium]|nr:UTP--glucose-1-phosphate uridylyltransferase GalU [Chloroflexota bacterium]
MRLRKAVIPAAGLGTRFLPASKVVPKEMLPVVDRPVIQYVVEEAVAAGIEQIVIVTAQSKRALEDHFDTHYELEARLAAAGKEQELAELRRLQGLAEFIYVRQPAPLGNGHAVLCARRAIGDEPFAMLWGDDLVDAEVPVLQQLTTVFETYGKSVAGVMRVPRADIPKYGVARTRPLGPRTHVVEELVEKPPVETAPSDLALVKEYILTPDVFDELERTPVGKGGEIWLTDALNQMAARGGLYAYEFEGRRYDVGDKLQWLEANVALALKHPALGPGLREFLRSDPAAAR